MKRNSQILALAIAALLAADASAQSYRSSRRTMQWTPQWTPVRVSPTTTQPTQVWHTSNSSPVVNSGVATSSVVTGTVATGSVVTASYSGAQEALDEVNAARAARGLPPYVRDPGLTQAAATIATQRASQLIAGHTANDFAGLPAGTTATASGCAAWPAGMGWGSCCTYERHTYAGAAWATGRDGRRYMQLFVR